MRKLQSIQRLRPIVRAHRAAGRRIAFTNGCFDLLHPGHVRCLAAAKRHADILVVGLNTDASVRRLKGPGRPLLPEHARAEMVAALASVDHVVLFREPTPLRIIRALRPDVLVKGGDYGSSGVVGADLVRSWGGKVVLAPLARGFSTTALIERIRHADTHAHPRRQR